MQEPVRHEESHSTAEESVGRDNVRVGSPFAVDPEPELRGTSVEPAQTPPRSKEVIYDVGALRYTAMGAVAAAVMALGFGTVAAWWFPPGGALIAALGCVLSIFGLISPLRWRASACLIMHLGLFVFCFFRTLTQP